MLTNFKQHRLLSENYDRTRTLGLKNPHNLGIVSNRPDTAETDMEENMKFNMKHMHHHDEDDEEMPRHKPHTDDDNKELHVDDDNDLDSAEDSDNEKMDDDENSDMDPESEENSDEYPEEEEDELDAMNKSEPPSGRPHDTAAYMTKRMSESKKMPPWLKKDEDDEEDGKKDKKGSKNKKEENEDKEPKHKKGCKCKKCMCSSGMKESKSQDDRMDNKKFAKKIAEQYWQAGDGKYYSGVIDEDMLISNKEQEKASSDPGPGEVGYAPQTRIGSFDGKNLAEAVQHLIKKVERLERKINQMF